MAEITVRLTAQMIQIHNNATQILVQYMEIGVPGGIGVLAQRHAGLVNKSEHGYVLSRKMEEILVSLMDP